MASQTWKVSTRDLNAEGTVNPARSVDLGLLLSLLLAASNGVVEARAEAAHAVLAWRAGRRGVPRASTHLFIAALRVRPKLGTPCKPA